MPVWLVTGGTGFLGRHLLTVLGDVEVIVAGRRAPAGLTGRFVETDLESPDQIEALVRSTRPDVVIHLAGRTPPADPDALYRANTLATIHLLDALRTQGIAARVVLTGSAAELGPVDARDLPVCEIYPPRPADSYGLSKWLATTAGLAARPPLEVMIARIFNPIGPGLSPGQALGKFAAALATPGLDPLVLRVGDLSPRRDFIDVRDVARALIALAARGRPGRVYHVGTGRSHQVREGLDRLIALSQRSVRVEVDPTLVARPGPSDSRADIRRITAETGWRPEIGWEQSLDDLWHEARGRAQLTLTPLPSPV